MMGESLTITQLHLRGTTSQSNHPRVLCGAVGGLATLLNGKLVRPVLGRNHLRDVRWLFHTIYTEPVCFALNSYIDRDAENEKDK
jgi:hypothetical protein